MLYKAKSNFSKRMIGFLTYIPGANLILASYISTFISFIFLSHGHTVCMCVCVCVCVIHGPTLHGLGSEEIPEVLPYNI